MSNHGELYRLLVYCKAFILKIIEKIVDGEEDVSRRKKANELEDAIINLGALLIAALSGYIYLQTKSLIMSGIFFLGLLGIALAIRYFLDSMAQERLRKSGITDIDKMDGYQFEHYLALLFQSQGYKAKVTRAAGDYGADLILEKDNNKIVVQAKRYRKNVGINAVQQVVGSRAHYGASEAWVITNRDFTEAAYNLARSNGVRLINRDKLIEMILKMNPAAIPNPKKVMSEVSSKQLTCSRCGKKMTLRKGPKGEFYGCTDYPKCRNIKVV